MGIFDFLKGKKKDKILQWHDKYKVNIIEIDAQHKKLFALYNELLNAMYKGEGYDVLEKCLDELIRYIGTHFLTEENYMLKFNYPAYEEHKKLHFELIKTTLNLHKEFRERKTVLTEEVVDFLNDWLTNHVLQVDQQYASFFKKRGYINS
ncbi:MAG: bacteriohemerythrin [Thermodesulfovibrionales bacterium]|nr:bacteriohemerythrin [Thermodesulfovibrionales bacterium]